MQMTMKSSNHGDYARVTFFRKNNDRKKCYRRQQVWKRKEYNLIVQESVECLFLSKELTPLPYSTLPSHLRPVSLPLSSSQSPTLLPGRRDKVSRKRTRKGTGLALFSRSLLEKKFIILSCPVPSPSPVPSRLVSLPFLFQLLVVVEHPRHHQLS